MRILLILIFFISCKEGGSSSRSEAKPLEGIPESSKIIEVVAVTWEDGDYKSECISDEEDGHYFHIQIDGYSLYVYKYNSRAGDNCSSSESWVRSTYDINGNELIHVSSEYFWIDSEYNDASSICGLGMESMEYANIDGVECSYSEENNTHYLSIVLIHFL